jgi:hypothetical protein
MADAADSKSVARKGVWVQVPPPALDSNGGKRQIVTEATATFLSLAPAPVA